MSAEAFALTGTREAEPQPTNLVAGPLTVDLVNGNLRMIRYGGKEVLRAIGYLVRDRDWGTHEPELTDLSLGQSDAGFEVKYTAAWARGAAVLSSRLGSPGQRMEHSRST